MPFPRLPPIFVGALSDVPSRLRREAVEKGVPLDEIDGIAAALPQPLRAAPCFLDRLTGHWRYDFGGVIDGLPNDRVVLGTHMFTPVGNLLEALLIAKSRLPSHQFAVYLTRLGDAGRHQDALVEMLPMRDIGADVDAEFEVPGSGDTTVDWLIHRSRAPDILLDVKNRITDLVDYFLTMTGQDVDPRSHAPAHDHEAMLRGIENKLPPQDPEERLQGGWIVSQLQQEETSLRDAFESLAPDRVHFIILNNGHREGYILSQPDVDGSDLLSFLGLVAAPRLVFRADEG